MDCREVRQRELIEHYVVGTIDEPDREALEAHLFECDGCFREAETMQGLKGRLTELQHDVPRIAMKPRATFRWWWWALGAAAVVTLSVAALIWWTAATTPHWVAKLSPELAALTRIDAPYYEPIRLRGATTDAQQKFRAAMERYAAGDYAAAIPGLEEAADLDPNAANISFFLGASSLLTGNLPDGIARLRHTIDLGDTPFLEEALLLAAKAEIRRGDLTSARQHLRFAIDLNGDFEDEALRLYEALPKGE